MIDKKAKSLIRVCAVMAWLWCVGRTACAQVQEQASSAKETVSQPQTPPAGIKKDACVSQQERIRVLEKDNKQLKDQLEIATKEGRGLKQRLQNLEKEKDIAAISQKERISVLEKDNKQLKDETEAITKERKGVKQRLLGLEKAYVSLAREKAILEAMCSTFSGQLRSSGLAKADEQNFDKVVALNLGYAYGNQGKLGEAIREYRKALARDPFNKDIHYNLGFLFAKQKKYRAAIEEYKQALKGSIQDAEVYSNLAVIYATALKDQKTADEFYQKFLEISSKKETTP